MHPDEEPDLCAGDPWVSFQCPEPLECEPNYPYPVDNGLTCCATFTSDLAPECIGTKFHPNEIKGCCPVNEQRPCLKAHTDLGGSCIITTDHLVQEVHVHTVSSGFNVFGFNELSRFRSQMFFLLHKNSGFSEFPCLANNWLGTDRIVKTGRHCISVITAYT